MSTIDDTAKIESRRTSFIGLGVTIGKNVHIKTVDMYISDGVVIEDNVQIHATEIFIGKNTVIGANSTIIAYERFKVGDYSVIRPRAQFKARSIEIGDHFYSDDNPTPLIIGGGGADRPTARITIGNRCVMHDSFINVFMPVEIGDNVGLSPKSSIITHGCWHNVLEGFKSKKAPVKIGSHTIIGYGATVLMGVELGKYCTVGAKAVITKSFPDYSVVVGSPARLVVTKPVYPKEMTFDDKVLAMREILREYVELLKDKVGYVNLEESDVTFTIYFRYEGERIAIEFTPTKPVPFPFVRTIFLSFEHANVYHKDYLIDLTKSKGYGTEDEITDDLRDFLRHSGIIILSKRPFKSLPPKIKRDLYG